MEPPPAAVKPEPPAPPSAQTPTPTNPEPELADMENLLLEKIQITEDDWRDLMRRRAQTVQTYLLKTEKITADRLFIIAPKSTAAAAKGEARANLSLN